MHWLVGAGQGHGRRRGLSSLSWLIWLFVVCCVRSIVLYVCGSFSCVVLCNSDVSMPRVCREACPSATELQLDADDKIVSLNGSISRCRQWAHGFSIRLKSWVCRKYAEAWHCTRRASVAEHAEFRRCESPGGRPLGAPGSGASPCCPYLPLCFSFFLFLFPSVFVS